METKILIQKHNVQIILLKKIEYFENLKSQHEKTIESIPDCMRKTIKCYLKRIENCKDIIYKLRINYFLL